MSSAVRPDTPPQAVLQSLRDELSGNVFRGVSGFFAKYFEDKSWSAAVQQKLQEPNSADIVGKLSAEAPNLADFGALVEWLAAFQSLFFPADQPSLRFHSQSLWLNKPASSLRAMIYLGMSSHLQAVAESTRVVGEYHHSNAPVTVEEDNDDILHFCGRALQVFKAQPARLFLHGFRVCGTTLELWVFDRSGAYSSGKLDLAQRPDLLVQVLASYAMMGDRELGFNTFVDKHLGPGGSDGYVAFDEGNKLYLRPELMAAPNYLVGQATTCYPVSESMTGEPDVIVKFS